MLFIGGWTAVRASVPTGITVTVNRVGDGSDLTPGDGICDASANAGEQCTLRAAIEELNALGPDATPHRIEFNISGAGPFTLLPASALPDIIVPVEIDGATQPGAACPTNNTPATLLVVLDGSNAGSLAYGLRFHPGSEGSLVRGLVIGNFWFYGLRISADDVRVRCNHIGLSADGISAMENGGGGIHVSADNAIIGGQQAHAQRNVISGNNGSGIYISSGDENVIRNNYIGTTANGLSALPNSYGLYVYGTGNLIGGVNALSQNVISGNNDFGLRVNSSNNNLIQGNYIGVALDGVSPLPNDGTGVEFLGSAVGNVLGGTAVGEANLIAHNINHGVTVKESGIGIPHQNSILGNAIFQNGGLGIDLGEDGVDVNDPGDGDSGENERQNYPVITAFTNPIVVTLNSHANTQYVLDLYRTDSCDPSGFGEGQYYLLTETVTTDAAGNASFSRNMGGYASPGDKLTAVATDLNGNSSEFSACVTFLPGSTPTPTPTNTPTSTNTAVPTNTPTPTHTATPGPSQTPSHTPTPTHTGTPAPSPTSTHTPTPTYTGTPGPSPTQTPTPTPTDTTTPQPSPTPSSTVTPTHTATSAPSPTPGISPTPTGTPIIKPTPTSGDFYIYLPIVVR